MHSFPSEQNPQAQRYIQAHIALRQLRKETAIPISRSAFYRWLQSGIIPARKIVARWFVASADITAFAKESYEP
ncbi:MAG: helix-turn-helix domain-containing protein [Acidobacteria bacterium]|nr:helix-turn-helix domain-containing protein [Acidobacteriota bacterium]